MVSSLKLPCIFLVLCVSYFSLIMVSLGEETEFSYSSLSPIPLPSYQVTCAVPQDQCGNECKRRCSNTSHLNNCLLFCNKCCNKCLCVPPGTFGNKECCPCYNDWKTQQGGPKCP